MYLGTASDVPNLSLYQDGRIDCFEGFDRLFGLAHVLLQQQLGSIKDNGIKPCFGCFYSLCQGVCMIRVKKDREIEFLPQASHQSHNLTDSHKLALALRRTNQYWDL